jgi:CRP-like cAMP-binding protein
MLRRFEPFAPLEWTTLCSVARHARLLRLAAQRTLAANDGRRHVSCYLVTGAVRRRDANGETQFGGHDAQARRALFVAGDGASITTVSSATLLWVDLDPVAFLLGAETPGYAVEELDAVPDGDWMLRFVGPGLVDCLSPNALQAVFRALAPVPVRAGDVVVHEGEPADAFYVVANGFAEVQRGGRKIAELAPGDTFGADALVGGTRRNANVTMIGDGRVMTLPAQTFQRLVAERLVRWVDRVGPDVRAIDLSKRVRGPDGLRELAGRLDPREACVFDGGPPAERALAAFLASQRGVRAFALSK